MRDLLVKIFGWRATLLHGDPCVYDRWRWLRRHLTPGAVRTLDVGCGSGAFTMYAATIGNRSIGISFNDANNRKASERARMAGIPGVQFLNADLRTLPAYGFNLAGFDQIMCLETIEHIQEDAKFLQDVSRMLKPGGRILLSTPFKYYRHLLGDILTDGSDGGHVRWGYTHKELRELMAAAGIEVVREEYVGGFVAQQLTNIMRLIGKVNFGCAWLAVLPLRLFQSIDRPLTRIIRYPFLSVAVVGVKTPAPPPEAGSECHDCHADPISIRSDRVTV
jgi:2-polyprenyl-3-methyl-5-hydroxy-6-metoxy-1,4-benzoquinol methylase